MKKLLCLFAIILSFLPNKLWAEDGIAKDIKNFATQNSISEIEIEEHFNKIDELMTSEQPDMGDVYQYADQYLADNFVIRQIMKTDDLKKLESGNTKVLSRKDFLKTYQEENKILYDSKLKHRILNIEHQADKGTAKVTYTSLFKGKIKSKNKKDVWFSQEFITLSNCYDLLKLVNDKIKSYRAECEIEAIYKDPVQL